MQYAQVPSQIRWHAEIDLSAIQDAVAKRVLAAAEAAIAARGCFLVVLAGGNTPRGLYERLRAAHATWPAWFVYYGDERCAPRADAARNSRMAECAWLDHVPIPTTQQHPIEAELGAQEAAARYDRTLAEVGEFDVVLLGLGEDGHTASLFPGHPAGAEAASPAALPVFDAPKPPPERVSLSAARLSRTRAAFFLVAGADKRDAVSSWRSGAELPARTIAPPGGIDVYVESSLLRG